MKIIFFDVETTGLPISWKEKYTNKSNWPYIVQLAYIISYEDNEISEEQDYILKPEGFTIPEKSTDIHGISNKIALTIGKNRKEVLSSFALQIRSCDYVVAHNADFDINVLRCEFLRNNIEDPFKEDLNIICTMKKSIDFCKIPSAYGNYKWPSLQELYAKLFNKSFKDAHNAKFDVKATFECFSKLKQLEVIKITEETNNVISDYDKHFLFSFFKERDDVFYDLISAYFPLDEYLLDLLYSKLDWHKVSCNKNIDWSFQIIKKYKDKWNSDFLDDGWAMGRVKWYGLSSNEAIPWSIKLIKMFRENWAYKDPSDYKSGSLSANKSLPWCDELLEEFQEEWNWDELSSSSTIPWKNITIDKFLDRWNWHSLSNNPSLPWSIDFIAKHQDYWVWKYFNKMIAEAKINICTTEVMKAYFEDKIKIEYMVYLPLNKQFLNLAVDSSKFRWELLLGRGILPWTAKLIRKHLPKMEVLYINNNTISWSIELLNELEDILKWCYFSWSKFNLTEDFFNEFEHKINFDENKYDEYKINWKHLKLNKNLLWTESLFRRFYENLNKDWEFWSNLSWNELRADWTPQIIDKYKEHWDWNGLSTNTSLCWSDELIKKYSKKWNWISLSQNSAIEWSSKSLENYIIRINTCDIDFTDLDDYSRTNRPTLIINNLLQKNTNEKFIYDFLKSNHDIFRYHAEKLWEWSKSEISKDFIIQVNNTIKNENSGRTHN